MKKGIYLALIISFYNFVLFSQNETKKISEIAPVIWGATWGDYGVKEFRNSIILRQVKTKTYNKTTNKLLLFDLEDKKSFGVTEPLFNNEIIISTDRSKFDATFDERGVSQALKNEFGYWLSRDECFKIWDSENKSIYVSSSDYGECYFHIVDYINKKIISYTTKERLKEPNDCFFSKQLKDIILKDDNTLIIRYFIRNNPTKHYFVEYTTDNSKTILRKYKSWDIENNAFQAMNNYSLQFSINIENPPGKCQLNFVSNTSKQKIGEYSFDIPWIIGKNCKGYKVKVSDDASYALLFIYVDSNEIEKIEIYRLPGISK